VSGVTAANSYIVVTAPSLAYPGHPATHLNQLFRFELTGAAEALSSHKEWVHPAPLALAATPAMTDNQCPFGLLLCSTTLLSLPPMISGCAGPIAKPRFCAALAASQECLLGQLRKTQ
jgi:hypothetical protein